MNRNGLAEDPKVLDLEARNSILKALADAKNVAKDVDVRLATLPAWAYAENSPLGADRQKLMDAARERQLAAPIVSQLETRLTVNGPIWANLSAMESQSLKSWIGAVATQGDILDKYMPTEGQKELRTFVLLGIGLGAIFGPLLFTQDVEPMRKPMHRLEPPDWLKDGRYAAALPSAGMPPLQRLQIPLRTPAARIGPSQAPAMPVARPGVPMTASDFSKIPVPVPNAFQGAGSAVAPAAAPPVGPSPGIVQISPGVFRSAAPGAASPGRPPMGPGPHSPIYPRYPR